MIKRQCILAALGVFVLSQASAYNPPAGGENLFRLLNPDLLTGAASAAGGALLGASPSSVLINPALTAGDQRIALDLGYTALIETDSAHPFGSGARLGVLIPSRYGVFTASLNGVFSSLDSLMLGNMLLVNGTFSKDITEKLYVGAGVTGGFGFGRGNDWALYLDIGAVYNFGNVGFLKNFRVGGAISAVGKTFVLDVPGIYTDSRSSYYPGMFTPRIGVAAHLFEAGGFRGGFSFDISAPAFQNGVADIGLQFDYAEMIKFTVSWQANIRELAAETYNLLPAVSLSCKFSIDTQKNQFLSSKGWQKNDLAAAGAWQQINGGAQAVSAGVTAYLGMRDTDAPVIQMWGED